MSVLGALGGQLLLFALSLLLMQAALKRHRTAGLFAALPWGLIPSLLISGMAFYQIQQGTEPAVQEARAVYNAQVEQWATQVFPKAEEEAQRATFKVLWARLFELSPAIELCFHMGILAAIAVFLRRRFSRAGLLPPAETLRRWTAPWPLAWLVLLPAIVWVAKDQGTQMPPWALPLAMNLLLVGMAIFLFQGTVVAVATMHGWWTDPRTKSLVFLVLAGIFASMLFQKGLGLLSVLLMTGLFEPWMDLRRLHVALDKKKKD